jgi:hypothetical protein
MTAQIPDLFEKNQSNPPSEKTYSTLIGLDSWGQKVTGLYQRVTRSRAGINSSAYLLSAQPNGWVQGSEATETTFTYPDVSAWWQQHGETGAHLSQTLLLQAISKNAPGKLSLTATCDVYLVASAHEGFGRESLFRAIEMLKKVAPQNVELVFTLILAIDSPSLPFLPDSERANLNAFFRRLADLLVASEDYALKRIGWCYLLDTIDLHSGQLQPIQGLFSGVAPADYHPNDLQAHQAAELLFALATGIARLPDYRQTELALLHHHNRGTNSLPLVSTAAAGSLALPAENLTRKAVLNLSVRILKQGLIGTEQPSDLPTAQKMLSRWQNQCGVQREFVLQAINRQAGGQPIPFETPAPRTDLIEDERLVDSLMNWDRMLEDRWNHPNGPVKQIQRNAVDYAIPSGQWLTAELPRWLYQKAGGVRVTELFLDLASKRLIEIAQEPDYNQKKPDHWLKAMLRPMQLRVDPYALPDLPADRSRLQEALKRRMNHRAVWVRAAMLAMVTFAFLWAALWMLALVTRAGTGSPLTLFGLSFDTLPAFIWVWFACWVLGMLIGLAHLLPGELRIYRATYRLIRATQRKYQVLRALALRAGFLETVRQWEAQIGDWQTQVQAMQRALNETHRAIEAERNGSDHLFQLWTEDTLSSLVDVNRAMPSFEIIDLAQELIDRNQEVMTSDSLAAHLEAFCKTELEHWSDQFRLAEWYRRTYEEDPVSGNGLALPFARWMMPLGQRVKPALPLAPSEKASFEITLQRLGLPSSVGEIYPAFHFIGLPEKTLVLPSDLFSGHRIRYFFSGEKGHLIDVIVVHGISIQSLQFLTTLNHPTGTASLAVAQAEETDIVEVESVTSNGA